MTLNLFSSFFKFQFQIKNQNNQYSDFEKKIINIINFENRVDSSNHFLIDNNNANRKAISSLKGEYKTHLIEKIIKMLTDELINGIDDYYKVCFIQKCIQEKLFIIRKYKKKLKYKLFPKSKFNKFINYYDTYLYKFLVKYNHIFNVEIKNTYNVLNDDRFAYEYSLMPEEIKKIYNYDKSLKEIKKQQTKNILQLPSLLHPIPQRINRQRFYSFNKDKMNELENIESNIK